MTENTTAEGTSDNQLQRRSGRQQIMTPPESAQNAELNGDVPDYAHRLDEEFSINKARDAARWLHGYIRAGWDDRNSHEDHPYWLGEGMRATMRYQTVWRVKTAEEAASLAHQLSQWVDHGMDSIIGQDIQTEKALARMLRDLLKQVDIDDVENKLENTEYGDVIDEMRKWKDELSE